MTASQPNLVELAKQGNARAIAALMNHYLQPKGITAKAALDDGCLQVWLESQKHVSQPALVEFIRSGITNLGVDQLQRIQLYGIQTGDPASVWKEDIELKPTVPTPLQAIDLTPGSALEDDATAPSASMPNLALRSDTMLQTGAALPEPGSSDQFSKPNASQGIPALLQKHWKAIPMIAAAGAIGFVAAVLIGILWQKFQTASQSPSSFPSQPASQPDPPQSAQPTGVPTAQPPAATPSANSKPALDQALALGLSAAVKTQTADTKQEWQTIAAEWQQAIARLRQVPATNPNHGTAQQKLSEYQRNLIYAQQQARNTRPAAQSP